MSRQEIRFETDDGATVDMTPPDERELIDVNGVMVDADTGEVVGLAPERAAFRVHDRDSAEWVMERIADAEAELDALERRKEMLVANVERMKGPHRQRAAWLRLRFGPELEAWAQAELAGGKTRSIQTPWGRLAFRKTQPRLVVEDEEKAIAWAKRFCKAAVKKVERFLVSEVPDGQRKALMMGEPPKGFRVDAAGEKFSLDTGFKEGK